jgi:hypothetical protein
MSRKIDAPLDFFSAFCYNKSTEQEHGSAQVTRGTVQSVGGDPLGEGEESAVQIRRNSHYR